MRKGKNSVHCTLYTIRITVFHHKIVLTCVHRVLRLFFRGSFAILTHAYENTFRIIQ